MALPGFIENIIEKDTCWECPERRGISRVYGQTMLKLWRKAGHLGRHMINEQRGECSGFVPVKISTSRGGTYKESDGQVIMRMAETVSYQAACSLLSDSSDDFPSVNQTMHANGLMHFVDVTVTDTDMGTVEDVEVRRLQLQSYIDGLGPYPETQT